MFIPRLRESAQTEHVCPTQPEVAALRPGAVNRPCEGCWAAQSWHGTSFFRVEHSFGIWKNKMHSFPKNLHAVRAGHPATELPG